MTSELLSSNRPDANTAAVADAVCAAFATPVEGVSGLLVALETLTRDVCGAHADVSAQLAALVDGPLRDGADGVAALVARAAQLEDVFHRIDALEALFDQLYAATNALYDACKALEAPTDVKERALALLKRPLFGFGGDADKKAQAAAWERVPLTVTLQGASTTEFLVKFRATVAKIQSGASASPVRREPWTPVAY